MPALIPYTNPAELLPQYAGTPVEDLLRVHNLLEEPPPRVRAALAVLTCVDDRVDIHAPPRLAFVMRTAGARAAPVAFSLSVAVAVMQVEAIAVVTHDDCAMVQHERHRAAFIAGLVAQGWPKAEAVAHFEQDGPAPIIDPVTTALEEAAALAHAYPSVLVAPLMYGVDTGLLFQIQAG